MKKFIVLTVIILVLPCLDTSGGPQVTVPSYDEFSDWSRRHPDTDTDLDLYHRSWKSSPVHIGHGGFIEQEIFFPGDPLNPPECGAVLKCLKEFNHGFLPGHSETKPALHEKRQIVFFVIKGKGSIRAGGKKVSISDGSGVFMPAKLEYQFFNTGTEPLEVLIFSEDISDSFEPVTEMQVGNYHDHVPGTGPSWHWSHVTRSVVGGGFENPISFGVVTIDAFDMAHPHVAPIGIEEIWFQLKGKSLMFFGNRLFWHEEGEAFYITPNYKVLHCSINQSDEPMMWIYIGIRLDRNIPQTEEMKALIDSLTMKE